MTMTTNSSRNGVDTATLFATLDAVKDDAGDRQVPVPGHATAGSAARTASRRSTASTARAGDDPRTSRSPTTPTTRRCSSGPTWPDAVEYLLHALAACLTAGIANIAAARGVNLTEVASTVEGDIDLLGILGLSTTRSQRLPADPGQLRRRGRRPGEAAPASSSSPGPALGRLRRAHQRRARDDRSRRRLDEPVRSPGSTP